MNAFPRRQAGMTLVETLTVLGILGLLVGTALPGFRELRRTWQVRSVLHALSSDFALARMSAVKHGVPVVVCPGREGHCQPGSAWQQGWLVFPDRAGQRQPASQAGIISQHAALPPRMRVHSNQGRPVLRYLPSGLSSGSNLTVNVCADGELAGRVIVNNAGRIRSERIRDGRACDAP